MMVFYKDDVSILCLECCMLGSRNNAVQYVTGIILGMGSTNERRRYYVTPSFIDQAHTQNPCDILFRVVWQQWRLNIHKAFNLQ